MKIPTLALRTLIVILLLAAQERLHAQGTAFTYQGKLNAAGSPATGSYDLTFALFGVTNGGSPVTGPITNFATGVTNGLFTITLDFGNAFNGANYWLEIGVRTNGGGAFITLTPRQPITPTPYAITAQSANAVNGLVSGGAIAPGSISNAAIAANAITANQINSGQVVKSLNGLQDAVTLSAGTNITLTPSGNGIQIAASGAGASWSLTGNAGTIAGSNFVGTTDNQPLQLWANGSRALLLDGTVNAAQPNVIGGSGSNSVATGVFGSTIGGGFKNIIQTNANDSTVGGGVQNTIQTNARDAVISGGFNNTIQSNAIFSAVGGGNGNTIQTNAQYAVVPGGFNNIAAGKYSFAAGQQAQALYQGNFVWADSTATPFTSSDSNQFLVRATGGVGINTNNPNGVALNVNGTVMATSFIGNGANLTGVTAASVAAGSITGTLSLAQLPGGVVTNNATNVMLNGAFAGNGGGVTNLQLTNISSGGTVMSVAGATNYTVFGVSFAQGVAYGLGAPIVAADINNDGQTDLLGTVAVFNVTNSTDTYSLVAITNNGSGNYVPSWTKCTGLICARSNCGSRH